MASNPQIALCPRDRWADLLPLLFARESTAIRTAQVTRVLAEADLGLIDLSGLWGCWREGRPTAVVLTQTLPGRVLALYPPASVSGWTRRRDVRSLLRRVLSSARGLDQRFAQALVDPSALDARTQRQDFQDAGLQPVTTLEFQKASVGEPPGLAHAPWRWATYSAATADAFQAAIQATYSGTLDMPEITGSRSMDDVVAGHRAAGQFHPERWLLGHLPGEPAARAVLLLTQSRQHPETWDLTYLGLTPEARGRHLGRDVLAHAFELARGGARWLELAVDVRNIPALALYRRAGFLPYDRREVFLIRMDAGRSGQA